MKSLSKTLLLSFLALGILASSSLAARAQGLKPVAIVSVASLNETLNDIGYVTRAAGMADNGDAIRFLASAMTAGIDKQRPIGLYFVPKDREFQSIAFVPLNANGLATFLNVQKEQLGEAKDVGDGIKELGRGRKMFVKEQAGWAYVAEEREFLTALPDKPADLLGDLPKKYNVAVKVMLQNIPAELRKSGIDEIKLGMERFLDSPAAQQGKVNRDQVRALSGAYVKNIERLLNEGDEVLFGIAIDEQKKNIALDFGFAAREGTALAKSYAMNTNARTNFAGFMQPGAGVTLNVSAKASPEDIEQARAALKSGRVQWSKQIDDSPDIPSDKRDLAKGLLGQFLDIVDKNIESGVTDFGATVDMQPGASMKSGTLSFAAGGYSSDGAAVEKLLKSLVDASASIPNFPQVRLNAGSLGDLKLNRITVPLLSADRPVREALGDNLEIIVAVGPESIIVTGGKDADGLLKKIVDQSAQKRDTSVRPVELVVSLLPILRFAKSMHDHPALTSVISGLETTGNDRITLTSEAGSRTSTARLEVQEGVIRAIGEGVKGAGARMPGR